MKQKIITQVKYQKGQNTINPHVFDCASADPAMKPVQSFIEEAGRVEQGGEVLEYAVYRVFYKESPNA